MTELTTTTVAPAAKCNIRDFNMPAYTRWCQKLVDDNKQWVREIELISTLAQLEDGTNVILGGARIIFKSDEDMIQEVFDNPKNIPVTMFKSVEKVDDSPTIH